MLCLSDPDLHVCVGKVDITLRFVNWIHKTPANKWYFMWNLTSGIVFCSFESVKLYFCFMLCWVICSYDCGARGRQSAPTPGRWAMTRASVNCVMCGVWDGSLPQIDDEFPNMWGPSCTEVQCLAEIVLRQCFFWEWAELKRRYFNIFWHPLTTSDALRRQFSAWPLSLAPSARLKNREIFQL